MIDPDSIAELRVYPPLGIARAGNAPGTDDYVIEPEVIGNGSTTVSSSFTALARRLTRAPRR